MRKHWMGIAAALAAGTMTAGSALAADFSGVWQVVGVHKELKTEDGQTPPLKPEAAKEYAETKAKLQKGDLSWDPTARCISPGLPRMLTLPYPFQIIQRPDKLLYLFEWNYWNRRVDMTDKPQEAPYPLSLGFSKGRLQGDALVIETVELNPDQTFLDSAGLPNSEELKVTETMTLEDGGQTLVNRITITDPGVFTRPWTTVLRFKKLPDSYEIKEDICLDRTDAKQPAVAWPAG